jgi:Tol biopolymer transport system component
MSFRHDDWDIWAVAIDGSGLRNLTHAPGYQAVPAWSPDGNTIAFGADPAAIGTTNISQAHIYLMNPDGSNVRQITRDPDTRDGFPAWLPDGRLSFQRTSNVNGNAQVDLWVMNPDGTDAHTFAINIGWAAWRPAH